jgi:hypothetical protein
MPQTAGASTTTARAAHAAHAVRPQAVKVLYNQSNDASGYELVSQKFQKADKTDDAQGADDFTVPKGKRWTVTEVDVTGFYSSGGGPATSENVTFNKTTVNKKKQQHVPGAVVKSVTLKGKDSSGKFAISGIKSVTLKAGHYWVSVQANTNSSVGEWYWASRTKQHGSPAVWENPGNGYGTGLHDLDPV